MEQKITLDELESVIATIQCEAADSDDLLKRWYEARDAYLDEVLIEITGDDDFYYSFEIRGFPGLWNVNPCGMHVLISRIDHGLTVEASHIGLQDTECTQDCIKIIADARATKRLLRHPRIAACGRTWTLESLGGEPEYVSDIGSVLRRRSVYREDFSGKHWICYDDYNEEQLTETFHTEKEAIRYMSRRYRDLMALNEKIEKLEALREAI